MAQVKAIPIHQDPEAKRKVAIRVTAVPLDELK
jgi:hypothetical protein